MNVAQIMLAAVLSTGVEIPDEGVPMNEGWHQYTTRMEKRPAAIADEAAYLKWKWRTNLANPKTGLDNDALVEQFFAGGGVAMNINVVSPETLRDAQKHPEDHKNLIVRVWGWSGYFTELDKEFQDHIISRATLGV